MSVNVTGTRKPSVTVRVSEDESLTFRMTVRGPNFAFKLTNSRSGEQLMDENDEPVSETPLVYERPWPRAGDSDTTPTNLTMGMSFTGFTEYHYEVIHHSAEGDDAVIDATYSGTLGSHFQNLAVVLV